MATRKSKSGLPMEDGETRIRIAHRQGNSAGISLPMGSLRVKAGDRIRVTLKNGRYIIEPVRPRKRA